MEQKWEGDWDADCKHRLEMEGRTAKGREGSDNSATNLKSNIRYGRNPRVLTKTLLGKEGTGREERPVLKC